MTLKKWDLYNVSDARDIKQKVYDHDVGSGDQSTSLGGGIESPNMHLTSWEPHQAPESSALLYRPNQFS